MGKDAQAGTCPQCSVNIKNASAAGGEVRKKMRQRGSERPDSAGVAATRGRAWELRSDQALGGQPTAE